MNEIKNHEKGIAHLLLIAVVVVVLGVVGFSISRGLNRDDGQGQDGLGTGGSSVSWSWNGQKWQASGSPPQCQEPIVVKSPTDVSKASAILYPGQTRGQYKAHGGFRFEQPTNDVEVVASMDADLVEASRYIESGEVQVYLIFVNSCGVMYKLDHLAKLEPKFQVVVESLPAAKVDDSRTTKLESPVPVKAGDRIATAVGFKNTNNVAFDFGLLDLRKPNGATLSGNQSANEASYNAYGLCWLNNLPTADAAIVKNLPAGDGQSGKTSDYCK